MKILLNLIVLAAIAGLAYLLYFNIKEPIEFRDTKEARMIKIGEKLDKVRTSQEMFRDITGKFAHTFDTLIYVLKNDSIPFEQVFEDPAFPGDESKFVYKTIYYNALDSLNAMGIDIDKISEVPFSEGKQFTIAADTMTYQKTLVSVCESGVRVKEFMGKYADPRFSKFDNSYNPEKFIKFGDMSKPVLTGNWE